MREGSGRGPRLSARRALLRGEATHVQGSIRVDGVCAFHVLHLRGVHVLHLERQQVRGVRHGGLLEGPAGRVCLCLLRTLTPTCQISLPSRRFNQDTRGTGHQKAPREWSCCRSTALLHFLGAAACFRCGARGERGGRPPFCGGSGGTQLAARSKAAEQSWVGRSLPPASHWAEGWVPLDRRSQSCRQNVTLGGRTPLTPCRAEGSSWSYSTWPP